MINLHLTKEPSLIQSIYPLDVNSQHDYIIISNTSEIVGLFEIQPITKICGMLHLHIVESHQRKGYGHEAFKTLIEYLKDSPYKSLISGLPVQNYKILNLANKTKARCCGTIKDGIIYNNKLQDLILMQIEVS